MERSIIIRADLIKRFEVYSSDNCTVDVSSYAARGHSLSRMHCTIQTVAYIITIQQFKILIIIHTTLNNLNSCWPKPESTYRVNCG